MPVVINEFEVVDTPPPAAPAVVQDAAAPAMPPLPDLQDLRNLLTALGEDALRRCAH